MFEFDLSLLTPSQVINGFSHLLCDQQGMASCLIPLQDATGVNDPRWVSHKVEIVGGINHAIGRYQMSHRPHNSLHVSSGFLTRI